MARTPYDQDFGVHQGRVENPEGFVPSDGDYALVLGHVKAGKIVDVVDGDYIQAEQSSTYPGTVLQLSCKVRAPLRMPIQSAFLEPFGLVDGQTLEMTVDGGDPQIATFNTADFVGIGTARAYEVASVLNAQIVGILARTGGQSVQVDSNTALTGKSARVVVTGGTAAPQFLFAQRRWRFHVEVAGFRYFERFILPGEEATLTDVKLPISASVNGALQIRLELT